jgi:hypothetical protein
MELGAVEKVGDRYYAMVGHEGTISVFTADRPEGPFTAQDKNFSFLRGDCYFSRFFPTPDGLLVSHHLRARIYRNKGRFALCGQVNYIAPLKHALVDDQGTMRLGWWEGNNTLKGKKRPVSLLPVRGEAEAPALLEDLADIRRGTIIEGKISFRETSDDATPGLWIETMEGPCAAIRILSASETMGGLTDRDGSSFRDEGMVRLKNWQHVDRDLPLKEEVPFRLLVRHSHIELYLDGYLFNVYSLPEPFSGRIGFLDGGAGISGLKAWTMTLPDELPPRTSYYPVRED